MKTGLNRQIYLMKGESKINTYQSHGRVISWKSMFQDEQIPLGGRCHVICAYPRLDRLSAFLNLYIWSYLFAGCSFWMAGSSHPWPWINVSFHSRGFLEPNRFLCTVSYWNCFVLIEDNESAPMSEERISAMRPLKIPSSLKQLGIFVNLIAYDYLATINSYWGLPIFFSAIAESWRRPWRLSILSMTSFPSGAA